MDKQQVEDLGVFSRLVAKRLQEQHVGAEIASFEMRPGVTFNGIEAFLGNRVLTIPWDRLAYNKTHDKWDSFADYVARTLKGRSILPQPVNLYRVQDLVREQALEYAAILRNAGGAEGEKAVRDCEQLVERYFKGAKPSDAARYRLLASYLRGIICQRISDTVTKRK